MTGAAPKDSIKVYNILEIGLRKATRFDVLSYYHYFTDSTVHWFKYLPVA